ncbi:MAG: exodeoxyribonuclease V subunit gamma [Enterobacterales bacterium]
MFIVYYSNKLSTLKNYMVKLMVTKPLKDPFTKEIIINQSYLLSQWIQKEIAIKLGISANIYFEFPDVFILKTFQNIFDDIIPYKNLFSIKYIMWKIMSILPSLYNEKDFYFISKYLLNDINDDKKFDFSIKISEIFYQYLLYRPDWITNWEKGKKIKNINELQNWQMLLWHKLISNLSKAENLSYNIVFIYKKIIEKLNYSKNLKLNIPYRIFLFNIHLLPPCYYKIYKALSKHIDVHFFVFNPSKVYWEDIFSVKYYNKSINYNKLSYKTKKLLHKFNKDIEYTNNPLLISWGQQCRDNLYLITQLNQIHEVDLFIKPKFNNLLNNIKKDIFNSNNNSIFNSKNNIKRFLLNKKILHKNDQSININVCCDKNTEIQVLYNSLLKILEKDKSLSTKDIIVMSPNINQYIPSITSVFGNTNCKKYLPFNILSQKDINIDPIINAFLILLKLPEIRCTNEQILDLLKIPSVFTKFDIHEDEIKDLYKCISLSGIHWGLDDITIEKLMFPNLGKYTWKFGLNRILLGYAIDQNYGNWENINPCNTNGVSYDLIGKLSFFLDKISNWRNKLSNKHTIHTWIKYINNIIDDFFILSNNTQCSLNILKNYLIEVLKCGIISKYKKSISVKFLLYEIINFINKEKIHQGFLNGSIIFCTLTQMRSIPFKVVCLIGMNYKDYPRSKIQISNFDLMQYHPRCGDINRNNEDKSLFMEAMLSAENIFYISFTGSNISNYYHEQSIVVSELFNYIVNSHKIYNLKSLNIDMNIKLIQKHIYTYHNDISLIKLKNFNFYENRSIKNLCKNFLLEKKNIINNFKFVKSLKSIKYKNLSLNELFSFYKHPIKYWLQKRLNIYFYKSYDKLSVNEPFIVNNLTKFYIKNKLINYMINKKNINLLYDQICSIGIIPYGSLGKLYFDEQYHNVLILYEKIKKLIYTTTYRVHINLFIKKIKLSGNIKIYKNKIIKWCTNNISNTDVLLLWITHVICCSIGYQYETYLFSINQTWHYLPIHSEIARNFLNKFIINYRNGMKLPIFLLNRTGSAWFNSCFDKNKKKINWDKNYQIKAIDNLIKAWKGNNFIVGECEDIYINKIINVLNTNTIRQITRTAAKFFTDPFVFNIN